MNGNMWLKRLAIPVGVGLIFFFLGRNIYCNWDEVKGYQWHFNYMALTISFILLLAALTFMLLLWRRILARTGFSIGFRKSWRIWFISNLGHYVPGKVWQIMGMVYLCQKEGVPRMATLASVIMAQVWSILSAFILLGIYAFLSDAPQLPSYAPWLVFFVPLGLIMTYPPVMEKLANGVLKWLRREPIHLRIDFRQSLLFLGRYLLSWFLYGAAFFVFLLSLQAMPWRYFPAITSVFATSYTLGFLCLVVPGGLGVREGLLTALLSLYMPLPMATVVSLLSRLWFTAGELVCLGLALKA